MNDETIEKHLRARPTAELPEAWRKQILSRARQEAEVAKKSREVRPLFLVYLRQIFARHPLTAGALTALWMLIFLFKASTPVNVPSSSVLVRFDPNRAIYLTSLSEQIGLAPFLRNETEQGPLP